MTMSPEYAAGKTNEPILTQVRFGDADNLDPWGLLNATREF